MKLLALVTAVFAVAAAPAQAVAKDPTPRVAVLKSASIPQFEEATDEIIGELARTVLRPEVATFDLAGDATNAGPVLEAIRRSGPNVVVTVGSLATRVALDAPIPFPTIFSMVLNPDASGFTRVASRPVTGASLDIPPAVAFRAIRRLLPAARRIGVLYNEAETGSVIAEARRAAEKEELVLVAERVDEPASAVQTLGELMEKVDCVWSVADSHVFSAQTTPALILAALRRRVPFFGLSAAQVRAGAVAALSSDYRDVGRQTAALVTRALDGADLSKVPLEAPRSALLTLNLRTANHLGIRVPADLEREAAEVIR